MVAQWKLTTKQQQRFDINLDIKKNIRNISIAVNFNFFPSQYFFFIPFVCKLCGCFHNSWPQTKINHEWINFLPSIVITNYSRAWIYAQSNCIFITTSGFLLFEWILLSGYTPETSIFILMCSDGWIMIKVIRNLRFCIFNGMSLFIRKRTFFWYT